jgi:hypothetical protein
MNEWRVQGLNVPVSKVVQCQKSKFTPSGFLFFSFDYARDLR